MMPSGHLSPENEFANVGPPLGPEKLPSLPMNFTWHLKAWNELTTDELYEILALRIAVFVLEQNCPYQDADGKDKNSLHLFTGDEKGKCRAYLRLVEPGISYEEWSIGRVVTHPDKRGTGLGRELMQTAMKFFEAKGTPAVRLSAQAHLQKFYEDFGFARVSDEYLEDDIPHIQMLYTSRHGL
jgi:ElaA protein